MGLARLGPEWFVSVRHGIAWHSTAWTGGDGSGAARRGVLYTNEISKMTAKVVKISEPTNDAAAGIAFEQPYSVAISIVGTADLIFHRWSCDSIEAKAKARKNSQAKKTDDVESYVWRDNNRMICLPGEYLRQSVKHAAKFRQDPRSPRKSAMDLYTGGIISETPLASLGTDKWDFEDRRRVVVQRNGVTRVRPAMHVGWTADFIFTVITPEYIKPTDLHETLTLAGRLIGVGDNRPTYGRFQVSSFKTL